MYKIINLQQFFWKYKPLFNHAIYPVGESVVLLKLRQMKEEQKNVSLEECKVNCCVAKRCSLIVTEGVN